MVGIEIGAGNNSQHTLVEQLYALCAYASAGTIFVLGGYVVSTIARDGTMSAPWQIVVACMAVPLLAAAAVSCGNHRENRAVRAVTWMIVAPLGALNPLAWLGAFVILARPHRRAIHQHAAGD